MPFYPHELLSVLRVIHIFNLVASSQNRKCHGDGVVRITLSSTDRDRKESEEQGNQIIKQEGVFMLAFLKANYLTILIILVLVAIVVGIICSIVKDKKAGRNTCGANCAHCANAGCCHQQPKKKKR